MDGHLRIGDAEREQAAAALGEHYAQGRITVDEHAERLDTIWAARTHAELEPVFRDLPDGAGPVRRGAGRDPQRQRPPAYWSSGWSSGWSGGFGPRRGLPPPVVVVLVGLLVLTVVTHVPFVLLGLMVVLFVTARHRRRGEHGRRSMRW